jgi:ribosomal protein S27AE
VRRARLRRGLIVPASVTCPRCGMTSRHPDDIAAGYCGNCHDWTSPPGAEVREIPIRRRPPGEAKALMIAGGIPEDMAEEIANS